MKTNVVIFRRLGRVTLFLFALMLISSASASANALRLIRPGALWRDSRGKIIQAHGGCIIQCGHLFDLFGEDRSRENNPHKHYVGNYRYVKSFRPVGHQSRDIGEFTSSVTRSTWI